MDDEISQSEIPSTTNATISCDQCDESTIFPSARKLLEHMQHAEDHKPFCTICNIGFKNYHNFGAHIRFHHIQKREEDFEYPCEVCGKCYKRKCDLNKHFKIVHKVEENLRCNLCEKPYQNIKKLKIHTLKCLIRSPQFEEYHRNELLKQPRKNNCDPPIVIESKENDSNKQKSKENLEETKNENENESSDNETGHDNENDCSEDDMLAYGATHLVEPMLKKLKEEDVEGKREYGVVKESTNDEGWDWIKIEEEEAEIENSSALDDLEASYDNADPSPILKKKTKERKYRIPITPGPVRGSRPSLVCPVCAEKVKYLSRHMADKHPGVPRKDKISLTPARGPRPTLVCPVCAEEVKYLSRHMADKHPGAPRKERIPLTPARGPRPTLVCPVCAEEVKYLSRHMAEKHPGVPQSYSCKECPKIFDCRRKWYMHTYVCKTEPCLCDICSKIFKNAIHLKDHIKQVHEKKLGVAKPIDSTIQFDSPREPKVCPICAKKLVDLRSHMRDVHSDKPDGVFPCNECGKIYVTKKKLKDHKFTAHKDDPQMCPVCSIIFKNGHALKGHIRTNHEDRTEQTCPICLKSFETKMKLYFHNRSVHLRKKTVPTECNPCGVIFKNKTLLKNHQRESPWCQEQQAELGESLNYVEVDNS